MIRTILTVYDLLRDTIIPPRPTETIVRALTLEKLLSLPQTGSTLPYHDESVRALVWEIKYYANSRAVALCGSILGEALIEATQDSLGKPLLIPIPMHASRRKDRGYNQTEMLAKAALVHAGDFVDYAPNIVVRAVNTSPQQGLPQHKRRHNVAGSMKVIHPEVVKGRVCILLDDVSTTGATFDEGERVLKSAGARQVERIALAHS